MSEENPYERFEDFQKKKEGLYMKAAHKAMDIAEDAMNLNVDNSTKSGIGWKELAVIGAALLGGGYLATAMMGAKAVEAVAPIAQPTEPQVVEPQEQAWDLIYHNGESIPLEEGQVYEVRPLDQ